MAKRSILYECTDNTTTLDCAQPVQCTYARMYCQRTIGCVGPAHGGVATCTQSRVSIQRSQLWGKSCIYSHNQMIADICLAGFLSVHPAGLHRHAAVLTYRCDVQSSVMRHHLDHGLQHRTSPRLPGDGGRTPHS
jgi:hypothetical protein